MPEERADDHSSVETPHSVTVTVDLDDQSEPATSIVEAVSEATNRSVLDLVPLAESIDPDALNQLFADRATSSSDLEVTFTHAGVTVLVAGTGTVRVTPQ